MDIAALIDLADNAFTQVKKVSSLTEDANAIMGNLTGLASHFGELKKAISVNELQELHDKSKPAKAQKNNTERALQIYAAKVKLVEIEKELYHMFLYGDLCHLGLDGYKEFCKIREDMEKNANEEALEHQAYQLAEEADMQFINKLKIVCGALFGGVVAIVELAHQIKDLFS